jgi:SMC interacting uncharacterized protein involved in chromosome segregation
LLSDQLAEAEKNAVDLALEIRDLDMELRGMQYDQEEFFDYMREKKAHGNNLVNNIQSKTKLKMLVESREREIRALVEKLDWQEQENIV